VELREALGASTQVDVGGEAHGEGARAIEVPDGLALVLAGAAATVVALDRHLKT
jgi:hypothetical protein